MRRAIDDSELAARLRQLLGPMEPSAGLTDRVRHRLRSHARREARRAVPRWLAVGVVSIAVVAAFSLVLYAGLALRGSRHVVQPNSASLTGGPTAVPVPGARRSFVWLTGGTLQSPSSGPGGTLTGRFVDVLDWTGALRYHFRLPDSASPPGANDIQTISGDGTRALLTDGTVLDETGTTVGAIPGAASIGPDRHGTRWMSDKSGVCVAFGNQGPPLPEAPIGDSPPSLPGISHTVQLAVFSPAGHARVVANVGTDPLGVPSGAYLDSTSVLSCNAKTDVAVVARYHDATDDTGNDERSPTDMTVSLWAIRLSSGAVLFHQPETRMALGRPFFVGSANGHLAVEFLWNSAVPGSEVDRVIRIPSGIAVPVTDAEPSPDTPALSSDGSRILRRVVYNGIEAGSSGTVSTPSSYAGAQTALELLDSSNGKMIRRVVVSGTVGATAVAEPGGSGFMVDLGKNGPSERLLLVDGRGGITVLHPPLTLGGSSGVGIPSPPGVQG